MRQAVRVTHVEKTIQSLKRNVTVFRFITGNAISFFGDQIYFIALPIMVLKLTGSPLTMGIVTALERVPIWLQPIMGVFADRFDRKKLLMISDLGRCLIIGLMGILFILNRLDMWSIYVGAIMTGILSQLFNASQFASIPKLVRKEDLQSANAMNMTFSKTAKLLGPGLGGLIVSLYNPGYALLINGFSFLLSFLTIISIPLRSTPLSSQLKASFFKDLHTGFAFVLKTKPILYTNLAILTSMTGITFFLTLMVFHLREAIHLSPPQIGLLLSIGGGGAILGSLSTQIIIKKMSQRKLLFVSSFFGGVSIIFFSFAHTFFGLVISNAMGDFLASMMNPCIITMRQRLTPEHLMGRVQATSRFMSWISLPLSSFLAGLLALHVGSNYTILIGGALATVASFFYLHPSMNVDDSSSI